MLKVSIITACYNSASTIRNTLDSVVNQDYQNVEYIIIDGASSDNTVEIVNSYGNRISKISSGTDGGIYPALNKGISMASGDIIALLHSDDFYTHPKVISNMVALIESNGCDAVYADLQYVNYDNTNRIIRHWKSGNYSDGLFLSGWMPPHPTLFVKKSVYDTYGVFNTSLQSAADYEFMLRVIHKHKIKVAYLPEVIVKMRVGGKSNENLKNRIRANEEDRKAWEINEIKPRWYTLYMKPIRKITQWILKYNLIKMNYWLIKSEPFKYSWDTFVKDGKTFWDGVRNYAARNNLKAMKKGDLAFFYHSNEGLEIVGIAKVVKEAYQDPTTKETAWVAVELTPFKKLKKAVSLSTIKSDPVLQKMDLVRLSRLSVGTVKADEFAKILLLSETKI